jgi:hypothetical protein
MAEPIDEKGATMTEGYGVIVTNPDWTDEMLAKARRGELTPTCHDGSDHLEMRCHRGHTNHLHRTQVEVLPRGVQVGGRCHACDAVIFMGREQILAALDEAWGRTRK